MTHAPTQCTQNTHRSRHVDTCIQCVSEQSIYTRWTDDKFMTGGHAGIHRPGRRTRCLRHTQSVDSVISMSSRIIRAAQPLHGTGAWGHIQTQRQAHTQTDRQTDRQMDTPNCW